MVNCPRRPILYHVFPDIFIAVMRAYTKYMPFLKEESGHQFLISECVRVTANIVATTRKDVGEEVLNKIKFNKKIEMTIQFDVPSSSTRGFIYDYADAIVESEIQRKRSKFN